jgi:hypothetical protein
MDAIEHVHDRMMRRSDRDRRPPHSPEGRAQVDDRPRPAPRGGCDISSRSHSGGAPIAPHDRRGHRHLGLAFVLAGPRCCRCRASRWPRFAARDPLASAASSIAGFVLGDMRLCCFTSWPVHRAGDDPLQHRVQSFSVAALWRSIDWRGLPVF